MKGPKEDHPGPVFVPCSDLVHLDFDERAWVANPDSHWVELDSAGLVLLAQLEIPVSYSELLLMVDSHKVDPMGFVRDSKEHLDAVWLEILGRWVEQVAWLEASVDAQKTVPVDLEPVDRRMLSFHPPGRKNSDVVGFGQSEAVEW